MSWLHPVVEKIGRGIVYDWFINDITGKATEEQLNTTSAGHLEGVGHINGSN